MYVQQTFFFDDSIEYEYKFQGKYGAKGEKREKRNKPTTEQIARQNQWNRQTKVRRLIKANFRPGDYWITLRYRKGHRPTIVQVKKDFKNFRDRLKRRYKKIGVELKYIYRMEIGKNGGIHIHFLVNAAEGITGNLINTLWSSVQNATSIYYTHIYEDGDYEDLADYITKKPSKEIEGQLNLFGEEERNDLIKYNCSRNLKIVEPEVRERKHWTMRKLIDKGPEPTPGYYIVKDSIRSGVNRVTGYSYFYYTERRIRKEEYERDQDISCHHRKSPAGKTCGGRLCVGV